MAATRGTLFGALLLVLIAGCGGGDDGGGGDSAATTAPDATPTTEGPSFSGAGSEQFCAQALEADQRLGQLAQSGSSTPEATLSLFTSAAETLQSLAAAAPGEIKADVELIAVAYRDLAQSMQSSGGDLTRLAPEATARLVAPDVTNASNRLATYQRQVCGHAP